MRTLLDRIQHWLTLRRHERHIRWLRQERRRLIDHPDRSAMRHAYDEFRRDRQERLQ